MQPTHLPPNQNPKNQKKKKPQLTPQCTNKCRLLANSSFKITQKTKEKGLNMNQLPRSWESSIRKLNSAIRRSSLVFPAGMSEADPNTPGAHSSASSTIHEDDSAAEYDESDDEGDEALGEAYHAEKLHPNGDFFTGEMRGELPHGVGKYLWTDGCMYEGAWRRGRTAGRGKFSWPSGATYEGDLAGGNMHGHGTYIGTFGDTYAGAWVTNLRHGRGTQAYANGDVYDGHWRGGLHDGHGRYIWRTGHEYVGAWKDGVMHGRGTVIWADGDRYDGGWENGRPKGHGSFRWADGGMYIGVWSQDCGGIQAKGVYYPPPGGNSLPVSREPREVITGLLAELEVCAGDTVSLLPSQKTLNWPGVGSEVSQKQAGWRPPAKGPEHGRKSNAHSRSSVSELESVTEGEGGDGEEEEEAGEARGRSPTPITMRGLPRAVKKQGETISKGHKNYELMLNLQLGIRHAVGRQSAPNSLDLKASAFDPKEKVWTRFPPEGSKHTPPHQSCDFRWKDYCPLVFRTLRKLFNVDPADYMISICGNDALRELSSPGKSGSFFYLTNDDKYMIKTMKKSEVKVLLRMLPAYYNHVRAFENTLVTKFFGLHCVKLTGAIQRKVRFVIMGNLFCSEYAIHRRFDLKGSSHGRMTDKSEEEIDETTTLKDLDLNFLFRLQRSWFQEFCRQVDRDCEFLEQERIMDYSLLVGVHFKDSCKDNSNIDGTQDAAPHTTGENGEKCRSDSKRCSTIRLGINMPSRIENIVRTESETMLIGEPTGEYRDVILFFGIIDILQDYDISKKLEHAYKSMQYDPNSISAVDPRQYCKRFRDFIYRAFTEDP